MDEDKANKAREAAAARAARRKAKILANGKDRLRLAKGEGGSREQEGGDASSPSATTPSTTTEDDAASRAARRKARTLGSGRDRQKKVKVEGDGGDEEEEEVVATETTETTAGGGGSGGSGGGVEDDAEDDLLESVLDDVFTEEKKQGGKEDKPEQPARRVRKRPARRKVKYDELEKEGPPLEDTTAASAPTVGANQAGGTSSSSASSSRASTGEENGETPTTTTSTSAPSDSRAKDSSSKRPPFTLGLLFTLLMAILPVFSGLLCGVRELRPSSLVPVPPCAQVRDTPSLDPRENLLHRFGDGSGGVDGDVVEVHGTHGDEGSIAPFPGILGAADSAVGQAIFASGLVRTAWPLFGLLIGGQVAVYLAFSMIHRFLGGEPKTPLKLALDGHYWGCLLDAQGSLITKGLALWRFARQLAKDVPLALFVVGVMVGVRDQVMLGSSQCGVQ